MRNKFLWLSAIGCALVLLTCTFFYWPILGHDYSLIVPGLIDLKVAFSQYGVVNPHFSPMKCLGTPLWANPVSFNLSILHLFTVLSDDVIGIALFIPFIALTSFIGAYKLSRHLGVKEDWSLYLASGWTLQGWMILRTIVGHTTYLSLGWFPLIIYLLIKKRNLLHDFGACFLAAFLLSQYVFLAAPYTPFFLLGSMVCNLPLIYFWNQRSILEWKSLLWKTGFTGILTVNFLYPKLTAVRDLMSAYPRPQSLMKVGLPALAYSVENMFSFLPHDYKGLVEWWYGNWESVQYLFPLFLLASLLLLVRAKDENRLVKTLGSVFYLVFVSFILCSGMLADVFQKFPLLNSMHVNPRWNIITAIPLFFLCSFILKTGNPFSRKWLVFFFVLVFAVPFLHLDKSNLIISYTYRNGYVPERNRLSYCYEPFLGYNLEFFPFNSQAGRVDFLSDPYNDPRCYLPSYGCSPGTPLSLSDKSLLESYKLE